MKMKVKLTRKIRLAITGLDVRNSTLYLRR